MTLRWFAAMTAPRMENTAARNLKLAGINVFYPFIRVRKSRKRANTEAKRVVIVEEPYFPGYLFVGLKPHQAIYSVNMTDGIATVVYCGSDPLQIPDEVMTEIMARSDGAGQVASIDRLKRKELASGALVRFRDNTPLAGLIATVSVDAGNKIKVWCSHLGRISEITVSPESVAEIA
jgi:transcription antitermination factor NusG